MQKKEKCVQTSVCTNCCNFCHSSKGCSTSFKEVSIQRKELKVVNVIAYDDIYNNNCVKLFYNLTGCSYLHNSC